ncbi:MAG: hypothetical protein UT37_C0007G0019 [Parcubacteria group bacterium GW2011_GWA2_39_18]|nr:MAG: hypothetical protein UT37_C0007G0019 [Parcubacteria group bacterium GW2011_GWA2_39_18]
MYKEEIENGKKLIQKIEELTLRDALTWRQANRCGIFDRYECRLGNLQFVFEECGGAFIILTGRDNSFRDIFREMQCGNLRINIRDQLERQKTLCLAKDASQLLNIVTKIFGNT